MFFLIFYPNLKIFFYGYIRYIRDISQLCWCIQRFAFCRARNAAKIYFVLLHCSWGRLQNQICVIPLMQLYNAPKLPLQCCFCISLGYMGGAWCRQENLQMQGVRWGQSTTQPSSKASVTTGPNLSSFIWMLRWCLVILQVKVQNLQIFDWSLMVNHSALRST